MAKVKKPETINYRTLKPEKMVCSMKEFSDQLRTGLVLVVSTKGIRYRGIVCDRCGVEVTSAKVRRETYRSH